MLIALFSNAQSWCTPNSVWHFSYTDATVNPIYGPTGYTKHTYLYDTIVNNKTYNKILANNVYRLAFSNQLYYSNNYFYTSIQNDVIFFNGSNPTLPIDSDTLIYFGPIGAKWRTNPTGGISCSKSYLEIVDTGRTLVQGQLLKWKKIVQKNFYLNGSYLYTGTDTIYERIGFKHFAYQFGGHCSENTDASMQSFSCFHDNQISMNVSNNTCEYINLFQNINEKYHQSKVVFYPNPVKNQLTIDLTGQSDFTYIEILNIFGEILIAQSTNDLTLIIDVSKLTDGIYFAKINNVISGKFVKQ